MSKLVFLFVCVALFQLATALECYHCDKEKCEKDMKSWEHPPCATPTDKDQKSVCLKHVYKDSKTQKETVSRKCVFADKKGDYKCGNIAGETVSCNTCDTELCNSASRVNFSFVAVCTALFALFAPKVLA